MEKEQALLLRHIARLSAMNELVRYSEVVGYTLNALLTQGLVKVTDWDKEPLKSEDLPRLGKPGPENPKLLGIVRLTEAGRVLLIEMGLGP